MNWMCKTYEQFHVCVCLFYMLGYVYGFFWTNLSVMFEIGTKDDRDGVEDKFALRRMCQGRYALCPKKWKVTFYFLNLISSQLWFQGVSSLFYLVDELEQKAEKEKKFIRRAGLGEIHYSLNNTLLIRMKQTSCITSFLRALLILI